jgi:hypothetical protein
MVTAEIRAQSRERGYIVLPPLLSEVLDWIDRYTADDAEAIAGGPPLATWVKGMSV